MVHHSAALSADLVVVGAGVVGLAHAVEARARGLSVIVVERDARAVGASVRNFGHVGTTLQGGEAAAYAAAARDLWLNLAPKAGFEVLEAGTVVVARSEAELAVMEEFAGEHPDLARLLGPGKVRDLFPLATAEVVGGAHLPQDLRIDPREAIPALAAWLESTGVRFAWNTHVGSVEEGVVHTARGDFHGARTVFACGHSLDRLFPDIAEDYGLQRCLLHMLEVAPPRERADRAGDPDGHRDAALPGSRGDAVLDPVRPAPRAPRRTDDIEECRGLPAGADVDVVSPGRPELRLGAHLRDGGRPWPLPGRPRDHHSQHGGHGQALVRGDGRNRPGTGRGTSRSRASSVQTATHAVLPSVVPQFSSLFLYRVDTNVRDALTLGVIGAGGIGFYITQAIQEFQFNVMMTYVLMVMVMVIALDLLSAWLRGRIMQ